MAKNLKLKIKNAQLAEALNLNKDKTKAKKETGQVLDEQQPKTSTAKTKNKKETKAPSKKVSSKTDLTQKKPMEAPAQEETAETGAPKKKIIKATNQPSVFQEVKQAHPAPVYHEEAPKEETSSETKEINPLATQPPADSKEDFVSGDLKFDVRHEPPVIPERHSPQSQENFSTFKKERPDFSKNPRFDRAPSQGSRPDSARPEQRDTAASRYPRQQEPYRPGAQQNRSGAQQRPFERNDNYRPDSSRQPYRPAGPPRNDYQTRPSGTSSQQPRSDSYQNRPPRQDYNRPASAGSARPYSSDGRPPFQRKPFTQPLDRFAPIPELPSKDGKPFRKEPKGTFKPPEDRDDASQAHKKARDVKTLTKTTNQKGFDSRDRQGLRADGEEGSWRRKRPKFKMEEKNEPVIRPKNLKIKVPIALKDLAASMKLKASELIAKLLMQGIVLTLNDYLDDETVIQLLGTEFDCEIQIDTTEEDRLKITGKTIQEEIKETPADKLTFRPPVVAFMGHVDHGKTSLIDALRKSNLAAGEAGAITQHIGAFQVHTPNGNITVLDTPGHEAFSEMRERGATVTDVVILVVAGDEGIMQQTLEAVSHAKKAGVPIVVAINKCDKPNFNADNVYRQLAEHELLPEEWGGSTITVKCSALTKQGVPQLLEMLLLQAEILELKANKDFRARGTVIESQLHQGMGCVITVLVQNGTLRQGDALVFDDVYGRVKTMQDEYGKNLKSAGPSCPVKITGLSGLPEAGCEFIVVENEKEARNICEERSAGQRHERLHRRVQVELEGLLKRKQELSEKKVLNLILRADVQGSLEALKNSLLKIPSNKVEIIIISEGVGQISESDIQLAATSNASIVGFHTNIESHAEKDIARLQVSIISHDIIYHLIDEVKKLMTLKLDKVRQETELGSALVKAVFKASQLGNIAGCQVVDGLIRRNSHAKLERNGEIVWEGQIASLKRVKDDVREVLKGLECGIVLTNYQDVQEGDLIKAYEITYLSQEL